MKETGESCTIDKLIAMKAHPYISGTRKCDLCLSEKLLIARANSTTLLSKRDELVSKCCYMDKFTLKCFKNKQNVILMIFFVNICSFLLFLV